MLLKTLDDLILLARVRHEVLKNDATVDQSLDIELFLEDRHHQAVSLCRFEPLELLPASILESQGLILVLQLDFKLLLLSLLIQSDIIEEYENKDLVFWVERRFVYCVLEIEAD